MEESSVSKNEEKNVGTSTYSAQSIKVLEGLEGVRKRPAMYIGSTGTQGLHHLVYEVVDNSVDEALAGYCNKVDVELFPDGSASVRDNGRGIPVDTHPTEGVSAAQVVLTKLHAGGKFSKDSYRYSGGLHGVGVSVVNALSEKLYLEIERDGRKFRQNYAKGNPLDTLEAFGTSNNTGTLVKFFPDREIFEDHIFNYDILASRFRELAFLNKGLTIKIMDHATAKTDTFFFEGGIASFVERVNEKKNPIIPNVVHLFKDDGTYVVDFAFQYNESFSEQVFSFVNNIRTTEGGTHEAGFRSALTKACNKYGQKLGLLKDTKENGFSSDDVREGLVAVLSVKVPEPQFEGQTKTKLGNSEIKGIVDSTIYSFLDVFFEENPNITKVILKKAVLAQEARNAARKARELTRRKTALESSVLPGKLADCSEQDASKCEIFIVEGESAGGSAKQARDRFHQAILPIRGKIINVEKAIMSKVLNNSEIRDIITALGSGVGNDEFDVAKIRYHKIVIMTDADIDGSHIRILLLTFFFRHMRPLIESGYLYIAKPPLYKVKIGKQEQYLSDESGLRGFLFDWAKNNIDVVLNGNQIDEQEKVQLITDLFAYENELEKVSESQELSREQVNELANFLSNVNLTRDENGLIDENTLLEKASEYFSEFQVSLGSAPKLAIGGSIGEDEILADSNFDEEETIEDAVIQPAEALSSKRDRLVISHGKKSWEVPLTFFTTTESQNLSKVCAKIQALNSTPFSMTIKSKRTTTAVGSGILKFSDSIVTLGKTMIYLQRYKGLGEMQAEQLWETTMDPAKRLFLKVSIDDAIKADASFTSLMGEDVQERRSFIEEHAHFVKNLDV